MRSSKYLKLTITSEALYVIEGAVQKKGVPDATIR